MKDKKDIIRFFLEKNILINKEVIDKLSEELDTLAIVNV